MQKPMTALMQKEVSRKEFIGIVGFGVASIFGFGTVLKMLGAKGFQQAPIASGFGSGSYGGKK